MGGQPIKLHKEPKSQLDCIMASSVRELLRQVNTYNNEHPYTPILKEDVVTVMKGEDSYAFLYYK